MTVPPGLREGTPVEEYSCLSYKDGIALVEAEIGKLSQDIQIGILGFREADIHVFREAFVHNVRVHVLSIMEAQGVEFESVFIINAGQILNDNASSHPLETATERRRIRRNLLYIALTRAMDTLALVEIE